MTGFVLQGHICVKPYLIECNVKVVVSSHFSVIWTDD